MPVVKVTYDDGQGRRYNRGRIRNRASCLPLENMIGHAVSQYGGLDFAFNNAGFVGSVAGIVAC
jgi:hypothetical protein